MTGLREVLLLGAGVMKVTDIVKETFMRVTEQDIQPYLKSTFATGLSVVAACAVADGWRDRLVLAGGVAGAAAGLHEAYAVLTTQSDSNKAQVIRLVGAKTGPAKRAAQGASTPGARVPSL